MARRQDSLASDHWEHLRNDLQERDIAFLKDGMWYHSAEEDNLMKRERNSDTDQSLEPDDCNNSEKDPTQESGTNGRILERCEIECQLKLES